MENLKTSVKEAIQIQSNFLRIKINYKNYNQLKNPKLKRPRLRILN